MSILTYTIGIWVNGFVYMSLLSEWVGFYECLELFQSIMLPVLIYPSLFIDRMVNIHLTI